MGWFSSDKPENKRKAAARKRANTRSTNKMQDGFARTVGIGVTMATNPVLGIGMALLSRKKKRKK